jgi:hypothetical protein
MQAAAVPVPVVNCPIGVPHAAVSGAPEADPQPRVV